MSQKIKNEDGTETEVFTAEEVETQKKEAATKASDEVKTEAAKQLAAKEEELTKLKEKEANFGKFKTETEKEKEKREAEIKKLEGDVSGLRNTMVGNFKNDLLKQYAGTDADLAKKIEEEYKNFAGEAVTNDEISARMEKAAKLVGVQAPKSIVNGAFGNLGGRGAGAGEEVKPMTAEQKSVAGKMGITEADIKKYGDKV